jgi:hypothetical protein
MQKHNPQTVQGVNAIGNPAGPVLELLLDESVRIRIAVAAILVLLRRVSAVEK